jgi:nucleotide-binding universal stress UspA family protein
MKKILIALDYDPYAQKIAETGYALAKDMNAAVVLLHVVSEAAYYSSLNYSPIMGYEGFNNLDMVSIENVGELRKAAQDYLDKSKQHLNDDTIETIIKEGDFAKGILDAAAEMKADVIVMGSHGRRGLDKILMGSVVEQVLHKTDIPLFIIPTKNVEHKQMR